MFKLKSVVTRQKLGFLSAVAIFMLGWGYITLKVFFPSTSSQGLDFDVIWLAGRIWLEGQNPYDSSTFSAKAIETFGYARQAEWFYPPSWAPVSIVMGIFPFGVAEWLWRLINYLALSGIVVTTILWLRQRISIEWTDSKLWLGAAYGYFLQATPIAISLGQTSIISTFGMMLALYAMGCGSLFWATAGLYLLSLKPQLAIIFLVAIFFGGLYRVAISGGLAVFLAGTIAFVLSGFQSNLNGFLNNLDAHSGLTVNQPANLTGITNLLNYKLPTQALIAIAIISGLVLGFLIRRYRIPIGKKNAYSNLISQQSENLLSLQWVVTLISIIIFLIPLHHYDFVFLIPVAIIILYISPCWYQLLLAPGVLLGLRPGNLATIVGLKSQAELFPPYQNIFYSISAFLLCMGIMGNMILYIRTNN
mgnify:CR=1 FL=1